MVMDFVFAFIGGICKMICVWKCFEIDFVWCGRCVLHVCWTHVVQIETVYYDVLLFICYYIYKIILLFWAGVGVNWSDFGAKIR